MQSDPGIRSLDRKPFCSVCRNDNHFTRGCKVRWRLNIQILILLAFSSNGYYRFPGPSGREDDVLVSGFLTTREQEPAEQINLLESLWPEWMNVCTHCEHSSYQSIRFAVFHLQRVKSKGNPCPFFLNSIMCYVGVPSSQPVSSSSSFGKLHDACQHYPRFLYCSFCISFW